MRSRDRSAGKGVRGLRALGYPHCRHAGSGPGRGASQIRTAARTFAPRGAGRTNCGSFNSGRSNSTRPNRGYPRTPATTNRRSAQTAGFGTATPHLSRWPRTLSCSLHDGFRARPGLATSAAPTRTRPSPTHLRCPSPPTPTCSALGFSEGSPQPHEWPGTRNFARNITDSVPSRTTRSATRRIRRLCQNRAIPHSTRSWKSQAGYLGRKRTSLPPWSHAAARTHVAERRRD